MCVHVWLLTLLWVLLMACNDLYVKHILVRETKLSFLPVCSCDRISYTGTFRLLSGPRLTQVHTVYIYFLIFWGVGVGGVFYPELLSCGLYAEAI